MKRLIPAALSLALLAGCPQKPTDRPPDTKGDGEAAPVPGDATLPEVTDPKLLAIAARLPEDWSGLGVLEQTQKMPKGAPDWAAVACQVEEHEGKRYLSATGASSRIRNMSLARTSAAARARAKLAEWLATERLVGSEIVEYWMDAPGGTTVARARIPVPDSWQPCRPLPGQSPGAPEESAPGTTLPTAPTP